MPLTDVYPIWGDATEVAMGLSLSYSIGYPNGMPMHLPVPCGGLAEKTRFLTEILSPFG